MGNAGANANRRRRRGAPTQVQSRSTLLLSLPHMHTSSLLSLLTIIFSIQVIGSHLVAVVAAQTRPDWQADIVLRCGTNVPGVVVINSALNETYLIRPPPAAPTRLSLPEGSRVINARPANDRTGEVGYQLSTYPFVLLASYFAAAVYCC
jgi:hypothetical protein